MLGVILTKYRDIKKNNRRKGVCVMRISSINVAQPRNVNYNLKTRQTLPQVNLTQQPDSVSFKGLRADSRTSDR